MKDFNKEGILDLLNNNLCRFTYTKSDGSLRVAIGTRNMKLIEKHWPDHLPKGTGKPEPEDSRLVKYFDIEKEQWRTFNIDKFDETHVIIDAGSTDAILDDEQLFNIIFGR